MSNFYCDPQTENNNSSNDVFCSIVISSLCWISIGLNEIIGGTLKVLSDHSVKRLCCYFTLSFWTELEQNEGSYYNTITQNIQRSYNSCIKYDIKQNMIMSELYNKYHC